ncbi:MAG: tetratricopeptide repeat protein [Streptosporangiaceae bacterium]
MPSLLDGFSPRPDTAPALEPELVPGAAVALVPADELSSSGKTQLAAYFAESLWRSNQIEVLAWIVATDRSSLLSGFVQAASAAGINYAGDAESVSARLIDWLATTDRSWLVVLDDLRNAADADGLWPAGPAGRLLITTGDATTVSGDHQALTLKVPAFSSREAMNFLSGRLGTDPAQRSGAIDLVGDLGCEPVALAQASAVIASSGLSCRDYRHNFTQRQAQLGAAGVTGSSAASVTWTFSAEYADHLSRGAGVRPLLALIALLDGHAIPGSVFNTVAISEYLSGDGATGQPDPARAWATVNSLRQAGLLTVAEGSPPTVRISSVVQNAIRTAIPAALIEGAARAAANALVETWPLDDQRSWLATDLRACAASLRVVEGDPLWAGGRAHPLLSLTGQSLDSARQTGPAVSYWRALAADSERILGRTTPDTLMASSKLAEALLKAGQAAEAATRFERIQHDRASAFGPDHPSTIMTRVWLGRALIAAGQPEKALAVLIEAVASSEHVCGPDHADTLTAREEYATASRAAGHASDAIRAYRGLLADRQRLQGPRHADTMTTSLKLADSYLAANQVKDAIAQYKQVLADREGMLGSGHPDTLQARAGLASAQFAAGRMSAALQSYEETCAGYKRALGADHPTTLARQADLANAYYATGRLGDATTLLTDAVARCEVALPPGDPLTLAMRASLTNITG